MERKDNIGYKTPEHYFDNLQESIMNEIPDTNERKVVNLKWLPVVGVAAALIIAFIFVNPLQKENTSDIDSIEYISLEELTAEEFYEELYSEESLQDVITFNNNEIIEL